MLFLIFVYGTQLDEKEFQSLEVLQDLVPFFVPGSFEKGIMRDAIEELFDIRLNLQFILENDLSMHHSRVSIFNNVIFFLTDSSSALKKYCQLPEEQVVYRIYHSIFADEIVGVMEKYKSLYRSTPLIRMKVQKSYTYKNGLRKKLNSLCDQIPLFIWNIWENYQMP